MEPQCTQYHLRHSGVNPAVSAGTPPSKGDSERQHFVLAFFSWKTVGTVQGRHGAPSGLLSAADVFDDPRVFSILTILFPLQPPGRKREMGRKGRPCSLKETTQMPHCLRSSPAARAHSGFQMDWTYVPLFE